MLTITQQISQYNHSGNNPIEYIVIHDTGNDTDTPEGNANYFGGGNRNASAHYFVGDNSIVQVVLDVNASWNCGDGNNMNGINNHNSLSIEMCNTNGQITEATTQNTLDLVKMKMMEHNVSLEKVVRHYDASYKNCPAPWSANNWEKWYAFKLRLISPITIVGGKTVVPPPIPSRSNDTTPVQAPLNFSYPNNAKIVNDDLYIRDANGVKQAGHYVSNGDNVTILDVSGSRQLCLVEYPTASGVKSGYINNVVKCIQYYNQGQWSNGSTPENVMNEDGSHLGSLDTHEQATPLYRKNGMLHVVYNIAGHDNGKSGYVSYNGGFVGFNKVT